MASAPADFARASAPRMARTLRASRRPPPRRAARENRPLATAGFSAVAGGDAVAPKKNVKVLRPASVGFRTASTARSYASDATTPQRFVASPPAPAQDGFFEWQTKLMDDLASKYAKTDDAAAPASTAAKASSSSSSSDESSSDEVVEKKPLGTRLKKVGKKLAFWRK